VRSFYAGFNLTIFAWICLLRNGSQMIDGLKKTAKSAIHRIITGGQFPLIPSMEAVYQRLVQRDLRNLGMEDKFYPVGGAANYALLYLLIRAARELPIKSVLELGAGESSKLLDSLASQGSLAATITTLEHDRTWAEQMSSVVNHPVILTSLTPLCCYDFSPVKHLRSVNLLLIDGPPASNEKTVYARLGAVELIDTLDPVDFLIIVDDTHRVGEMLLVEKIERALGQRKMDFHKGQIITSKRQTTISGGMFVRASYY
jgi:hypothetical protein